MLDTCAPESRRIPKLHHWWIWNGSICYQGLPKPHGKPERAEVEIGHVRTMVRRLGIDRNCAERMIPGLWGATKGE